MAVDPMTANVSPRYAVVNVLGSDKSATSAGTQSAYAAGTKYVTPVVYR
jgi:hypothetical protein